jgi:hypothetical protein
MKRGLRIALTVGVVVVAAAIAGACAVIVGFATGVGMRAAYWHGSVPPLTNSERASIDVSMLVTFAGVFGLELALLGTGVLLMRYFRRVAEAAGPSAHRPNAITPPLEGSNHLFPEVFQSGTGARTPPQERVFVGARAPLSTLVAGPFTRRIMGGSSGPP